MPPERQARKTRGGAMTAVERAVLERFKALVAGRFQVHTMTLFGSGKGTRDTY